MTKLVHPTPPSPPPPHLALPQVDKIIIGPFLRPPHTQAKTIHFEIVYGRKAPTQQAQFHRFPKLIEIAGSVYIYIKVPRIPRTPFCPCAQGAHVLRGCCFENWVGYSVPPPPPKERVHDPCFYIFWVPKVNFCCFFLSFSLKTSAIKISLLALPTKAKVVVFRFIIEYI